jgi:hypothetical protein
MNDSTGSVTRFPKGAECQCAKCSRFFTSPSGFQFHQWTRGRGDTAEVVCLDPALIGMVDAEHLAGETWRMAGQDDDGFSERARKALIETLSRAEP